MPQEHPIVRLLREPNVAPRKPGQKPHFPRKISFQEQADRHAAAFARIESAVDRLDRGIDVSADPAAATPDRALVFEVIGPVGEFAKAATRLGFEWLAEQALPRETRFDDGEEEEPDDREETDGASMARLYLTMPSHDGLRRLLAYWRSYSSGAAPSKEARVWWGLFGYLADIRTWSAQDRIEPTVRNYIRRTIAADPDRPVKLILDLWFREDEAARASAQGALHELVAALGGQVLDFQTIAPIEYQAALISIPPTAAEAVARIEGPLSVAKPLQSIRPQSLYRVDPMVAAVTQEINRDVPGSIDPRRPIAALLDGYPVQNHDLLRNRIDIDEVDVPANAAPVSRRYHGTAMASLILHGDLGYDEPSLSRALKVIPILAAPQDVHGETTPGDKLALALVYRAVIAMKDGFDGGEPLAPDVVLINHSVCDLEAPFAGAPSAWAKLIDYLSHTYRLLFIISAGNIRTPVHIASFPDRNAFLAAAPSTQQVAILLALQEVKGNRGIFSPAEAANAISVGAIHADSAGDCPPGHVDPLPPLGMTNLCSAVGLGIGRAVKPDLVEEGGRQLAAVANTNPGVSISTIDTGLIGQAAAAPDPYGGNLADIRFSSGTSNAAALTTRSGIFIADAVEEVFRLDGEEWLARPTRAVILKALIAHSCGWGRIGEFLDKAFPPQDRFKHQRRRESITRFVGYGRPDRSQVITGDRNRVTLLADDVIRTNELHEFRLPIPADVIRTRELRRITMTLTWSTPVKPTQAYREIALEIVDANGKRKFWQGVKNVLQPDLRMGRRGTLMHLVLEGRNRTDFTDPDGLFIGIQARALNGTNQAIAVPYALAITLEVGQAVRTDIHADVASRIRRPVRVRSQVRVGARR